MKTFFLVVLAALSACATPYKAKAPVWLHNQLPAELCTQETLKFGLYRVISCSANPKAKPCVDDPSAKEYEEFLPYCDEHVKEYYGIKASDVPTDLGF